MKKSIIFLLCVFLFQIMLFANEGIKSESQVIFDNFEEEFYPIIRSVNEGCFDLNEYLGLDLREIAGNVKTLLKDYEKIYIESLQIECIRAGMIIEYYPFAKEIENKYIWPVIFERFENANRCDIILEYNGKPWVSVHDFTNAGVKAYEKNPDNTVNVNIMKSPIDRIIETEFRVSDEVLAYHNSKDGHKLLYGIIIYDGYLITDRFSENKDNEVLAPGTFFRLLEKNGNEDCQSCIGFKDISLDTDYLTLYMENRLSADTELYIWHCSPGEMLVGRMAEYFSFRKYKYIIDYFKDKETPESVVECISIIVKDDQQEFARIQCDSYKWVFLRDSVLENKYMLLKKMEIK